MNKQHFLTGLAAIGMSLFFSQPVFAECGAGKTDITIINPAGKIIELCVPDAAIPAIEEANPGGTVIPGRCPCFSPEDVESANQGDYGPLTCTSSDGITASSLNCSGAICGDSRAGIFGHFIASSTQRPLPQNYEEELCYAGDDVYRSISCKAPGENGLSYIDGLTVQQADACLRILQTFSP